MFTQSCIIRKNTQELVEALEKLGYKYTDNGVNEWFIPLEKLNFLGVNLYSNGKYMGVNGLWSKTWIDCGENEELFLAIVALRDDTDARQWFVHKSGNHWWKTEFDSFQECFNESNEDNELKYEDFHKATVEELIEHFNHG